MLVMFVGRDDSTSQVPRYVKNEIKTVFRRRIAEQWSTSVGRSDCRFNTKITTRRGEEQTE